MKTETVTLFEDRTISKEKKSKNLPLNKLLSHNNFNRFEHKTKKKFTHVS